MILNFIKGIIKNWPLERYIYFVIPFLITIIIYFFIKKTYKIDPYIFFACVLLCVLIGNWSDLSGTSFLIFTLFAMANDKIMIYIFFTFLIITISLKFIFLSENNSILDVIMYLIGFEFILAIYFNMIHPKTKIDINEDEINKKILKLLIQGNVIKQIAYKINLSGNAVAKRLENMRSKYNCKNNVQLISHFYKEGKIRFK